MATAPNLNHLSGLLSEFENTVTKEAVGSAELAAKQQECSHLAKLCEERELAIAQLTDKKTQLELTAIAVNATNESLKKKLEHVEKQLKAAADAHTTSAAQCAALKAERHSEAQQFVEKLNEASSTIAKNKKFFDSKQTTIRCSAAESERNVAVAELDAVKKELADTKADMTQQLSEIDGVKKELADMKADMAPMDDAQLAETGQWIDLLEHQKLKCKSCFTSFQEMIQKIEDFSTEERGAFFEQIEKEKADAERDDDDECDNADDEHDAAMADR
jgi:septal ring factor EnvC (AmiA/AmiB activator)